MYDERERTLLRKQDLAGAGDDQESAPERAGASPDSEDTQGGADRVRHGLREHRAVPGQPAAPRWTARASWTPALRPAAAPRRATGFSRATAFRRAGQRQPAVIWAEGFEHTAA